MPVRYAQSYIDQLYESQDLFALHSVITVLGKDRELPRQFWLFLELWNWCCSTRSGIWQYYERIPKETFERTVQALEKLNLREIAQKYCSGMNEWKSPNHCEALDRWIDDHWSDLEAAAFGLIDNDRRCLYPSRS